MAQTGTLVRARGGCTLLYEEYVYRKDRASNRKRYWRCTTKGCPGRASTSIEDPPKIIGISGQHNHLPDSETCKVRRMKTELCNLAKQDPVKTSSQVYSDWLANQVGDIEEEEVLPSLSSCRSMMNRARREEMPPLPASIAEIDLGPLSNTLSGDPFVLHHDDRMFVLSTLENLRALQDSSILFMDGMFKAAPRPLFSQLFCIHAVCHGNFVTLAYCLLIDKSRQTYHQLFEVLKRKMAENDLVMNPEQIMSDFESGLMPAIRHSFTNTQHRGCYFHHSQAVWRQVQRLGLQVVYREDHRVQTFVRKLLALAFLPVFAVRPAVTALQDELQDEPAFLEVPQLQQLLHKHLAQR
ncbi:hypothetical protein ACOMHN_026845 [Nucella lapillus]